VPLWIMRSFLLYISERPFVDGIEVEKKEALVLAMHGHRDVEKSTVWRGRLDLVPKAGAAEHE